MSSSAGKLYETLCYYKGIQVKYKDGWVCDWLPVKELIKYDSLAMAHKILHGNCTDKLQNKFTTRSQISNYSTETSQNLHLPKLRLGFTKNSFQFTGASG